MTTPSYVNMSYIITCCLICISLHYLKQPATFFRGCILTIISILLTYIIDITSHFIISFDVKNMIIFLIPVFLGIFLGLFTFFKFKAQNYPFYINALFLLCSFICYITITCDFLTPTFFDVQTVDNNTNENNNSNGQSENYQINQPETTSAKQQLYLLYAEVCIGMVLSIICLFGHISILHV